MTKHILLVCLFVCAAVNAQTLSISGTVRDATGAVPQASVTAKYGGKILVKETGADGTYAFDGLAGGVYNLSVLKPGFEPVEVLMTVSGASQTRDFELHPGAVSTTMVVTDVAGKASASRLSVSDLEIPAQVGTVPLATLQSQGVNDLVSALRNVSGVSAQRWYGVYEYYTVRGFQQSDVTLVDGMRLEGNRLNTQLNNVQQVEVLKGPSSILYGGQALSGVINIVRKKPQGTPAFDFVYRGGRFNTHQIAGGATGPIIANRLLYRVDASFDTTSGWRSAGSRRANVSPSVTWLINDRNRVTVHQAFNRDHFDGDGGLPIAVTALPNFDLSRRFSTPDDFNLTKDSQTQVLFNSNLNPRWEFRDGFFYRWQNDQYFVTESVGYNPATPDLIQRSALYFKHHRRPVQNQADVVGRLKLLGMSHTVLAGHEYQDFYNYSDRTANGGTVDVTPYNFVTNIETQPRQNGFPLARVDYFANKINALFWQDQIAVTERLRVNVGGRFDDYRRASHNDPITNGVQTRGPEVTRNQQAYTYRAGAVYLLPASQQLYFSSSSSFTPITTVPSDGRELLPERGRSFEVGHRYQTANNRFRTSLAFYQIRRENVVIPRAPGIVDQAGAQSSRGIDLDLSGELGRGVTLVANYGYTLPRFDKFLASNGAQDLSNFRPRNIPLHSANVWLTRTWRGRFLTSVGYRYVGRMFTNNTDTIATGGYSVFSGAFGYSRRNWEWTVNAENLLNRARYFQPAAYDNQVFPGQPINVFTSLRFRFY